MLKQPEGTSHLRRSFAGVEKEFDARLQIPSQDSLGMALAWVSTSGVRMVQRPRHARVWFASVAVMAVLGVLWAVAVTRGGGAEVVDTVDTGAGGQDLGFNPLLAGGLVIGDIARVPDGSVARVANVRPDVTLAPGLPAPEAGTRLVRLDVELCAGAEELFVDAAFWLGLGDDGNVHSAHMGVRDLQTVALAPGACQRGSVDLAVPDGVEVEEILLADTSHTTVARWAVDGQPGELEPLSSGAAPASAVVGSPADLVAGGFVTLHAVTPGRTGVQIDGELCAGEEELVTSPRFWFVQLQDHRLVTAERDGSTMQTGTLDPRACDRGTVDFSVPDGARVVAVVHASGGIFEEARWRVDR